MPRSADASSSGQPEQVARARVEDEPSSRARGGADAATGCLEGARPAAARSPEAVVDVRQERVEAVAHQGCTESIPNQSSWPATCSKTRRSVWAAEPSRVGAHAMFMWFRCFVIRLYTEAL